MRKKPSVVLAVTEPPRPKYGGEWKKSKLYRVRSCSTFLGVRTLEDSLWRAKWHSSLKFFLVSCPTTVRRMGV